MGVVLEDVKVSVKDGKPYEKVLTVEIKKEKIQKEYDQFYKALAPNAKIPGFRPGKAPRQILELHYGQDAKDQVLKNLISDSFRSALDTTSIEPLVYPRIEDVQFGEDKLTYKALIEVRPKIKLSRIKGLSAEKNEVLVKEEEITKELKNLQESLAQFKVVEDRASQVGDYLIADYVCFVDGKEIDKRTDDWLEVRDSEFLKGLGEQLTGLKPGEEKEAEVEISDKLTRKDIAGKKGVFKIKVKEVKAKILPELNDDLAKEAGEFSTLNELKDKIRKDLTARKDREAESAYENGLLEQLVKHNKVDLPPGLVQKRQEHLLEEAKQGFLRQGFAEGDFDKEKEKLQQSLEAEAKRQIHLAFLLDEIAVTENLSVAEEDLKKKFEQVAARVQQPLDQIEKFYASNQGAREALEDQIRNEKSIQFIKDNAKGRK